MSGSAAVIAAPALLVAPVMVALLGALACLVLRHRRTAALVVGAAVGLAVGVIGVIQALSFGTGIAATAVGGWRPPVGIVFVGDGLSAAMIAVSGVIVGAGLLYRWLSVPEPDPSGVFPAIMLFLLGGICGAFSTGDLFNLFVWFEVIMLCSFSLLVIENRERQIRAAVTYVLLNLLASAALLLGLGILYGVVGTLTMADVGRHYMAVAGTPAVQHIDVAVGLLLVAFAIKAGSFPLYAWLPASYHTPSYTASGVFAGLLTKVGVYALLRLTTVVAPGAEWLQTTILVAGTLTMVMGIIGAVCQNEVRRILSYHIISQIGYLLVGVAFGTATAMAAVLFYLVHHIIVKANLFFVGGLLARAGAHELYRGGGLRAHKGLLIAFLVPALSLAGLPPFSGFFAKLGILASAWYQSHPIVFAAGLATGLLTLFSMMKILLGAFWTARDPSLPRLPEPSWQQRCALIPVLSLAGLTVTIGLCAGPLLQWSLAVGEVLVDAERYQQVLQAITVDPTAVVPQEVSHE